MRLTIKREELVKALNIASRAVGGKVAVSALSNLKFELDEKGLFITGSNYDLTIKTFTPYKIGENDIIRNYKEGCTLLNTKIICDIARKMSGDELTLDVIDSTIATISDTISEYQLNCVKPEEYPDLDLEPTGTKIVVARDEFSKIVSQTAFAASTKEQRPALTALNLEAENGVLTATATDSARMARKQISIPDGISFSANVPAKMMVEIDHLTEGANEIEISFSDKKALFIINDIVISTRLIAAEYPNTKNIVPKITNHLLEVPSSDLLKAIDRANILSIERENVVELTMTADGVEISAKSSQIGSAVDKLQTFRYEGEDLKISFNSEFVNAAIRALNSSDVTFLFVGEMKPFIIKNASDDSVVQIVTPVRTY